MTEEAFGRAVRAYGDTVYRVALHALKNPADAEDVMQTVMLRLLESGRDFESEEHLKHWLLRVAVNESRIAEYVRNQLKEDEMGEQLRIPSSGPFTGGK